MLKTWIVELWLIRAVSAFTARHVFLFSSSYVPFFPSLLKAQVSFLELHLFCPYLYSYHISPSLTFIKMDRKMKLKYLLFVAVHVYFDEDKRVLKKLVPSKKSHLQSIG